jgi:hypothetical protein
MRSTYLPYWYHVSLTGCIYSNWESLFTLRTTTRIFIVSGVSGIYLDTNALVIVTNPAPLNTRPWPMAMDS